MSKKFWIPTMQLIVSGVILSSIGGAVGIIRSEIKFHAQVNQRLGEIETALNITHKEKADTHVAVNP